MFFAINTAHPDCVSERHGLSAFLVVTVPECQGCQLTICSPVDQMLLISSYADCFEFSYCLSSHYSHFE